VQFIRSRIAISDAGATDRFVVPAFAMHVLETSWMYRGFPKHKHPEGTSHENPGFTNRFIRHHENPDTTIYSIDPVIEAADRKCPVVQGISAPLDGIGQASSIFAVNISTLHSDLRSTLPPVSGIIVHSPEIPAAIAPGSIRVQWRSGIKASHFTEEGRVGDLKKREDYGCSQEQQGAVGLCKYQ
jgi:hypothetical protein